MAIVTGLRRSQSVSRSTVFDTLNDRLVVYEIGTIHVHIEIDEQAQAVEARETREPRVRPRSAMRR